MGTDKKVNKKQFSREKSSKPKSISTKLKKKMIMDEIELELLRSQMWAQRNSPGIAVFPWNLTCCGPPVNLLFDPE